MPYLPRCWLAAFGTHDGDQAHRQEPAPVLPEGERLSALAVEVYNKPAVKFKSEGYIALMVMAWTALMHAIFLRKGRSPYYKANGRYLKVDGDQRCWKRYGVRPSGGAKTPAATQEKYCVYDEPHKDYLYTPAWVDYLIEKMRIDGEYESLYEKK